MDRDFDDFEPWQFPPDSLNRVTNMPLGPAFRRELRQALGGFVALVLFLAGLVVWLVVFG